MNLEGHSEVLAAFRKVFEASLKFTQGLLYPKRCAYACITSRLIPNRREQRRR